MNVPHDRAAPERKILHGESMQETATRVAKVLATPTRAAPVTPLEYRDPDAPPGWYDDADMSAYWG